MRHLRFRCSRSHERDSINQRIYFSIIATSREMFGLLRSSHPLRIFAWSEKERMVIARSECSGNHISVAVNTGSQSLRLRQDDSDDHADVISPSWIFSTF